MTRRIHWVRGALLVLSVTLIMAGLLRDEHRTVLKKAVNICLECIGIG